MGKFIVVKESDNQEKVLIRFEDKRKIISGSSRKEATIFENEVAAKTLAYEVNKLEQKLNPYQYSNWQAIRIDN